MGKATHNVGVLKLFKRAFPVTKDKESRGSNFGISWNINYSDDRRNSAAPRIEKMACVEFSTYSSWAPDMIAWFIFSS